MNEKVIVFRVDSSLQIGTGHVMRCLTLADELRQKGAEVQFICREFPGNIISIIQSKGYAVFVLPFSEKNAHQNPEPENISHKNWLGSDWEEDAKETYTALLAQGYVDWLVVDHYAIEEKWEQKQREIVSKILVIDDLADRKHNCDLLIDQNYYENMVERYIDLVAGGCRQLLGPEYALLRKEFREVRQNMQRYVSSIEKIFIFFGGVDLTNITEKVVEAISGIKFPDNIVVDIVVGSSNPHRKSIELLCNNAKNLFLHIQIENMAQMMAEADLCIGSGGTVTWERCCLGLPTIAWAVAENQQQLLKDCAKAGMLYAPDSNDFSPENIAIHIQALSQNLLLRTHIMTTGMRAIDGKGAIRVANIMLKQGAELSPATLADMQKIYKWRNHISVRKNSRSPDKIGFDEHSKWFEEILSDPDRLIFIGWSDDEEIGVLRFDISGNQAEISIYLLPGKQGYGYGIALVTAGENWLNRHNPDISSVSAEVLPENKASVKLFESSGYKLNQLQYQKRIN
ncbi:Pseudaminic acid cytidylyltransferase [hydrothermal vent metagenome]|uniref:Pseudaminic acid cytidylyltransferase n=1 Tax=hydrothermal vent metagenome TaxID=652676 RepID=A0A3B0XMA8_9ZZZZ